MTLASTLPRIAVATFLVLALGACSSDDDDASGPPDDGTTTEITGGGDGTDGNVGGDSSGGDAGRGDAGGSDGESGDGSNDGAPADEDGLVTLDIDASAGGFGTEPDDPANRWTYLDLDTGRTLGIDDDDADASREWEIAFKRVAVRLNGGVSGPGEVRGGIVDAQLDFYDEAGEPDTDAFVAATAESERAAIVQGVDPAAVDYVEESEVAAIVGDGVDPESSWWIYDPAAFSVTANPSVRYAVRGADGESYAKARVTDIQQNARQITVELELQPTDQDAFAAAPVQWVATIGGSGSGAPGEAGTAGSACYDFDAMGEVDCVANAASWDLQAEIGADGRAWSLWTNGGVRGEGGAGASFGPLTADTAAAFASADDVPLWNADATGGAFDEFNWYGYDLRGENRIWPNYRVYAIDNGPHAWKLQILRYYDEAGIGGMLRVRFGEVGAESGDGTSAP